MHESPKARFNISKVSLPVLPNLTQNLMHTLCSSTSAIPPISENCRRLMQYTHKDTCNNQMLPHPTTPLDTLTHKTPPQHTLAGNSWTTSDLRVMTIVLGLLDTPSYIHVYICRNGEFGGMKVLAVFYLSYIWLFLNWVILLLYVLLYEIFVDIWCNVIDQCVGCSHSTCLSVTYMFWRKIASISGWASPCVEKCLWAWNLLRTLRLAHVDLLCKVNWTAREKWAQNFEWTLAYYTVKLLH